MKMKNNIPKPLRYNKSNTMKEVYSNQCLYEKNQKKYKKIQHITALYIRKTRRNKIQTLQMDRNNKT